MLYGRLERHWPCYRMEMMKRARSNVGHSCFRRPPVEGWRAVSVKQYQQSMLERISLLESNLGVDFTMKRSGRRLVVLFRAVIWPIRRLSFQVSHG